MRILSNKPKDCCYFNCFPPASNAPSTSYKTEHEIECDFPIFLFLSFSALQTQNNRLCILEWFSSLFRSHGMKLFPIAVYFPFINCFYRKDSRSHTHFTVDLLNVSLWISFDFVYFCDDWFELILCIGPQSTLYTTPKYFSIWLNPEPKRLCKHHFHQSHFIGNAIKLSSGSLKCQT